MVLNPTVCRGKPEAGVVCPFIVEFFLEAAAEYVPGDDVSTFASGLVADSGGELRLVPRLTWQVGHNFTNLEMSSFGTLDNDDQLHLRYQSDQKSYHEYTFLTWNEVLSRPPC